jgi:hypothetical protein
MEVDPSRSFRGAFEEVAMPAGRIIWCDERSGDARVEHLGREYPAHVLDIEPDARVAGAPVHFDVERSHGAERAINVVLVPGLRTSVHQHRRGEVTHARPDQAGHKPMSDRRPWHVTNLERAPAHQIAAIWLRHVQAGEVDDAVAIYAPDAVVHIGVTSLVGRDAARRALLACPLFDHDDLTTGMEDESDAVVVGWSAREGTAAGMTRLRMQHGEISEQWLTRAD